MIDRRTFPGSTIAAAAVSVSCRKARRDRRPNVVETGALPDRMPVNPEMKMELPVQNIR